MKLNNDKIIDQCDARQVRVRLQVTLTGRELRRLILC